MAGFYALLWAAAGTNLVRSLAQVRRGMAQVRRGMAQVRRGTAQVRRGMAQVRHGTAQVDGMRVLQVDGMRVWQVDGMRVLQVDGCDELKGARLGSTRRAWMRKKLGSACHCDERRFSVLTLLRSLSLPLPAQLLLLSPDEAAAPATSSAWLSGAWLAAGWVVGALEAAMLRTAVIAAILAGADVAVK
ncbi:unnamed protein product, partial [Closterium sp. Naga37s-1]